MKQMVVDAGGAPLAIPVPRPAPPQAAVEEEFRLGSYLDALVDSRWLLARVTALCLLVGGLYVLLAPPVYEASMLMHVEEDQPNNAKNMIGELSSLFDVKAAAISEMELIKSRMVISNAVDHLGLYIDARPVYFPVLGPLLARHAQGLSTPGLFGHGGYAWGSESIDVAAFYVPDALHNARFTVTLLDGGRYRLEQPDAGIDVSAPVGARVALALAGGPVQLQVKSITARPGTRFELRYLPKLDVIERVQKAMTVAEIGKQSGLVRVTYEAGQARQVYDVLTEITREYERQNVSRKLEEAEKSLAFLDRQLPEAKRQLDESEAEYYRFRKAHGTIDLAEESKLSLERDAGTRTRMLELQQKREELLVSFTPDHPLVRALDRQLRALTTEARESRAHISEMPMLERDLLRLNRQVKVNTELYGALLNSAQQLRLVKAGKVSNVRLVDRPVLPERPAGPGAGKVMGLALGAAAFLGLFGVVLRRLLQRGFDHPRHIERLLGARVVYASVPFSAAQQAADQASRAGSEVPALLACRAPSDPAIESLRSFRAALQVAMPRYRNNRIVLCAPTGGVGRSFIAANLAVILASAGKRVLLIDADLRGGRLAHLFAIPAAPGLSEAIAHPARLDAAIRPSAIATLDILPTGTLPPNPAEFLLHPDFEALLGVAGARYDAVLLCVPPLLAVADGLTVAAHAGAVFVIARARHTTDDELTDTIERLNHAGTAPHGVLFNGLRARPLAAPVRASGAPRLPLST